MEKKYFAFILFFYYLSMYENSFKFSFYFISLYFHFLWIFLVTLFHEFFLVYTISMPTERNLKGQLHINLLIVDFIVKHIIKIRQDIMSYATCTIYKF